LENIKIYVVLYNLKLTEWGTTPSVNQLFHRLNVSVQMVVSKWITTVHLIKPMAQSQTWVTLITVDRNGKKQQQQLIN